MNKKWKDRTAGGYRVLFLTEDNGKAQHGYSGVVESVFTHAMAWDAEGRHLGTAYNSAACSCTYNLVPAAPEVQYLEISMNPSEYLPRGLFYLAAQVPGQGKLKLGFVNGQLVSAEVL